MYTDPGPWGPKVPGGHGRRRTRRLLRGVGLAGLVVLVALASTGFLLYEQADDAVTRVPVEGLDGTDDVETAEVEGRNFLVVGSDERTVPEDAQDVALGDVDGQRSDALLYVSLTEDRDRISVLSLPRDLLVEHEGREMRLGDTFEDGAGALVRTVQKEFGLPVHHYAKVTFGGFIEAVETLGAVELCLDDPLVDPDAGADLPAGCQELDPEDALAFVRSREGARADYERIERQQRFMRATVDELTQRRVLSDVPRLFDLVEDVAGNVVTDDRLGLAEMLGLADDVRDVVDGDVPMVSVPAYPDTSGRAEVMRVYRPGATALFETVREGGQVADRGTPEQRAGTSVALWSGGRAEAQQIVASVLLFGGFEDRRAAGRGPAPLDAGGTTTVYGESADDPAARRVAALLGAPVRTLPADHELPRDADVAVAVGRDATGSTSTTGGSEGDARTAPPDDGS